MKILFALVLLAPILPAVGASAAPAAQTARTQQAGTTIIGDGEAPAGMFITPWQNEQASDIDWPPRILEEPAAVLEPEAARRRMELDAARAAWRRSRLQQH